jgi:hypothetical protein
MKDHVNALPVPRRGSRILLVVLLCTAAPGARAADFEYWPKATVLAPIGARWLLGFEEKLSIADDAGRLDDHQTDFVVTYLGLADWLAVGLGYKAQFDRAGDDWPREDRPYLNVAVKTKIRGFGVIDRSRFEYRMPEDEEDSWRYRNKLIVTSPLTFTALKIQPYAAQEVFYSFDGAGFEQHRLFGGVFIPLHEKVRLELFYLWKLDKQDDDDWQSTNILGSWVYFSF